MDKLIISKNEVQAYFFYYPNRTVLNLDIKNPNAVGPENGDPEKLLVDYKKLLGEIGQTRDALKKELMGSLGDAGA